MSTSLAVESYFEHPHALVPYTQLLANLDFDSLRETVVTSANALISSTKSANASAREDAVAAAEKAYSWLETLANVAYSIGSMGAWTSYLTSVTTAGINYADAMKTAADAYLDTEHAAWDNYTTVATALGNAYNYALNAISSNPSFDGAGYVMVTNEQGNNSEIEVNG